MKKYIFIAAALATAFLAGSCQKEKVQDSITLSTEKSISAVYEAASYDVVFTTNVAWTATAQATAGDVFFALDKTSGSAGTATLKLSVEKNEAIATRTGIITITAGTATQVINIIQDAVGSTSEDQEKSFDFLANEFEVAVKAKPSQVIVNDDWVKYVADDDKVYFAIERNPLAQAREALVKIIVVKHTINLKIVQAAEAGELSNPSVSYLGNKALPYDKESGYTTFGQYQLAFETEKGAVVMVITTDPAEGEIDPTSVPEGLFEVDASGKFADETFAIAGEYPSVILEGDDNVYAIVDGEIEIVKEGNLYTINAILVDEEEMEHSYSYSGELGKVTKDDFGAINTYNPKYSNYYTYFASPGIFAWTLDLCYSTAPSEDAEYLSWISFTVYSNSSSEIPTGNFTFEEPTQSTEVPYANGKMIAKNGTFTASGNSFEMTGGVRHSIRWNGTPTLSITKEDNGQYTFAVTANVTTYSYYDEDGNWLSEPVDIKTFDWNPSTAVTMLEPEAGSMGVPDAEEVTFSNASKPGNYVGYWYSDIYGDGWNAFAFGWNAYLDGVYKVFLTVNSDQSYDFVANYPPARPRYSTNPIPAGTYTFANEAAANTLLPTARCYIQNTYTGTQFMINGGSIVITDSSVAFDGVTGMQTSTGLTCTFNGSFDTTCMYQQDYSDHSKRTLPIKPVVGPQDN